MPSPDSAVAPVFQHLPDGITVIDTGYVRPGFDAAYLLVQDGRAAFIDTGVNDSVPRLLQALDIAGLAPAAVDWVILTHIHLDHAGGAGQLLARLPHARLAVHARGVRHMANPGPLMDAVRAVYGAEVAEREYGTLVPVPPERITALNDGDTISLAGRILTVIDSPGHARHHVCIWDPVSRSWFTGDAFGLCLAEFRTAAGHCIVPTTSPSQFEPGPYHTTVARLLERAPRAVFPTHAGEVLHPERLAPFLLAQVDAQVAAARAQGAGAADATALHEPLLDIYLTALHQQGWCGDRAQARAILGIDLGLNADGMKIWLDRELSATAR